MTCVLCDQSLAAPWTKTRDGQIYWHCGGCDLIFLHPEQRLPQVEEAVRYEMHTNTVGDEGYLRFVEPLLNEIRAQISVPATGLDFGCGRESAITQQLEQHGFGVQKYDPVFWPQEPAADMLFDFVVTCEVVEHFHHPKCEFAALKTRLKPGGSLFAMTHFLEPNGHQGLSMDAKKFDGWYYRKDPTHTSFYSHRTCDWIARAFGFARHSVKVVERRSVIQFVAP